MPKSRGDEGAYMNLGECLKMWESEWSENKVNILFGYQNIGKREREIILKAGHFYLKNTRIFFYVLRAWTNNVHNVHADNIKKATGVLNFRINFRVSVFYLENTYSTVTNVGKVTLNLNCNKCWQGNFKP